METAMKQDDVEQAIEACYDAVLMPETWSVALDALAGSLDAAAMLFYPVNPDVNSPDPLDPDRPLLKMPASGDYTGLLDEYVSGEWYLNHYRAERGRRLMEAGRSVILEHELATDDERKSLRHYNELYLRWGFPGFAMTAFRAGGRPWAVPMLRAAAQGHFGREEVPSLARLIPHLARMIRLSEKFALRHASAELDTLERLGCAAMVLDWKGAVLRVNAHAQILIGSDLTIRRGRLVASEAESNRDLQRLMDWVRANPSLARSANPPQPVIVRRRENSPLVVEALPVAGLAADLFRRTRALLVITRLDRRPRPPECLLRAIFGLTRAEERLALHLAGGDRLEDAAAALGITSNTARVQLKAIFAKTNTHRQTDLMMIMARLAR